MPPSPPSEAPTDRPGRFGPQETSDITPGKHYARFLRACDQTAALQARGTSISLFWCPGEKVEKHVVYLWYEDACNIYLWKRAERAARCQRILDAALEREHVNKDAKRAERACKQGRVAGTVRHQLWHVRVLLYVIIQTTNETVCDPTDKYTLATARCACGLARPAHGPADRTGARVRER